MAPGKNGLATPKQVRFVEEYLKDLNATQAAIRAGYSAKNAGKIGPRLVGESRVAGLIASKQEERAEKAGLTQEYVVQALTEVVERTLQRVPVMVFDREKKTMVQETDEDGQGVWTFDAKGAVGALNLLGRHLGMYREQVEHSGSVVHEHRVIRWGKTEIPV